MYFPANVSSTQCTQVCKQKSKYCQNIAKILQVVKSSLVNWVAILLRKISFGWPRIRCKYFRILFEVIYQFKFWLIDQILSLSGVEIHFGQMNIGVGAEKITLKKILGKFQSSRTLEKKYLRHSKQVFSTTKKAKASNAIVLKNGQEIGLMLVINWILQTMYHVPQILLL